MPVTLLKHSAAILYVLHTGGECIMNMYQVTKIWTSLSPGLVKPVSGHLPRDDENDAPKKKGCLAPHSDEERHHHVLPGLHFSTDSGMNVGVASIEPETRWEVW